MALTACEAPQPRAWRVFRVETQTLSEIARVTGVSVSRLAELNQLDGDLIRQGQGLLVPENEKTASLPPWRPLLPAPEWRECEDVRWSVAVERPADARCERRVCAGEACLCVRSSELAEGEVQFGAATWSTAVFPGDASAGALLHAQVDLDGDGQPESVVSTREAAGNGLGIEWWKHVVLSRGRPLASFSTADSGLAYVAQARGCAFLATTTDWRVDQLRGDGLYFLAQLHVVEGDTLRAVGPEVGRRATHRFLAQRAASLEHSPVQIVPWFTDVGAFVWPEVKGEARCRATTVLREEEDRFELAGLGRWGPRSGMDDAGNAYDALLDARTGARLLEDYRPFGETSWAGRAATVCEAVVDGVPRVTLAL
ncbi:MAG: LysM peptidoglycan-binding domain-containing protein [Myxococcota bacterium]